MIDEANSVEASIKPTEHGVAFREYSVSPDSPLCTEHKNTAYIEAVTNQQFGVLVSLKRDFDFMGSSHVKIVCDIDGVKPCGYYRRPKSARQIKDWTGCISRMVGGKRRALAFSSGEVSSDSDVEMTQEVEDAETVNRGRIEVEITRGTAIRRKGERVSSHTGLPDLAPIVSKKVAIDRGRSHSL
ncbi:hypothetical protein LTR81_027859, partial [Elasticomyces elasticus]